MSGQYGFPIPEDDPGLALIGHPDVWGRFGWAVESFLAWSRPGQAVLDVGCGRGDLLGFLLQAGRRASGVDVDPDQARAARARFPAAEVSAYDGHRLPFPDGSFALVTMLEVLEHVADEAAMLAEVRRVLAPGGVLVLTTPHAGRWQFLDPDNFKFRAPGLHRLLYLARGRRQEYQRRFGGQNGTYGNFTFRRDGNALWHRHYRVEEVLGFARGFAPIASRREGGLLFSLALIGTYMGDKVTGHWPRPLAALMRWDARHDLGAAGYALHLVLRRTDP